MADDDETTDTPETEPKPEHDKADKAEPETDWVAEARKWERQAKDNLKKLRAVEPKAMEYDRLAAASQTAEEIAAEELKGSLERERKANQRAARSEVKAALAAVVDNPDQIIEDLDMGRFVDDDGEVDQIAVQRLRAKYAGFSTPRKPRPDNSQASAANGRSTTITPADELADVVKRAITRT